MRSAFLRTIGLVLGAVMLACCSGVQPYGTMYIRTDGQTPSPDQLAADQKVCSDAGDKAQRCMLEKGYFLVKEDEATQKQQNLAEIAQKNKEEQEALIAAEKAKQAKLRREAARKRKKKTPSPSVAKPSNSQSPTTGGQSSTNTQPSPWSQGPATFQPQR